MKRLRPLFPLVLLATPAFAATEFDDTVPAEVVEQVMGAMFGTQVRLYSDVPDGFPPFEMPRDMTLLASVDQGYNQRVILKSQFDPQAATALAYGALLDSGWELIPTPGMQMPQTGFVNPYQPVPQTQLCHDEHGVIQVSAQIGAGVTYVNLNRNIMPPGAPWPGCTPEEPQVNQQMPEAYRLLQEQMPRLVLPNSGGMSSSGGYGGGGGGPNEWEVRATVSGPWDIARVYAYFAEQIEAQGWDEDVNVTGEHLATGSWTKTVEDDVELVSNLIVLPTGANAFDLRFRLLRQGDPAGGVVMGIRTGPALGIRGIPAGVRATPIGTTEIIRD